MKFRVVNYMVHIMENDDKQMTFKNLLKITFAISVKFCVKSEKIFKIDVTFEPNKLLKRIIPRFKAYFKCNLKGLFNLCRIIDRFKATEQNISLTYFQSNFWAFFIYNCDTKLIVML